jgi:hypothetical protein
MGIEISHNFVYEQKNTNLCFEFKLQIDEKKYL